MTLDEAEKIVAANERVKKLKRALQELEKYKPVIDVRSPVSGVIDTMNALGFVNLGDYLHDKLTEDMTNLIKEAESTLEELINV